MYLDLRRTLKGGGVEDYDLEAKLILCAASGKTREELIRDMKLYAFDETERAIAAMVERRLKGEPIAYVLGEWEFMGLPFNVEPGVLIPRADTELLAELAVRLLRRRDGEGIRVLDLCCGVGCIGISIAKAVQSCRVVLVDNSMAALRVARSNITRNNVTGNTVCIEADAMKTPPILLGRFDLIVCNPPYVPTGEIPALDRGVKDFEPRAALDGGPDGLDFYRAIVPNWKTILRPSGCVLFECGEDQSFRIMDILTENGFENVASYPDLTGTPRVVAGVL